MHAAYFCMQDYFPQKEQEEILGGNKVGGLSDMCLHLWLRIGQGSISPSASLVLQPLVA